MVRYLAGTKKYTLRYDCAGDIYESVICAVDSDWAEGEIALCELISRRSGIRRICSQKQLGRILFQRHVQTVLGHAPLNGTWRANRK